MVLDKTLKNSSVWVFVGTRPEVIKQVPVYKALKEKLGDSSVSLIGTGQHKELLDQALEPFGVSLDDNFKLMEQANGLTDMASLILQKVNEIFKEKKPDLVIVQGDTLSAAMIAWASFLNHIPVAHNEAGLRTFNLNHPFPEEGNRRLISSIASYHFPPTELAKKVLLSEGIPSEKIFLVGNPGLDSLKEMLEKKTSPQRITALLDNCHQEGRRPVLLTAHRRENEGEPIKKWFSAILSFLEKRPDVKIIYPMHPNNVAKPHAEVVFKNHPQMELLFPPLNYVETCHLLSHCRFVVTDSGGIQEEASTLGVPVVVCRETSERMEAVQEGFSQLAGQEIDSILNCMEKAYQKNRIHKEEWNPIFGAGDSGQKMADIISNILKQN